MSSTPQLAPLAQGLLYAGSGLWPILHLRSFEAITGPKVDKWLVKTVGGLMTAIGAALIAGAFERRASRALRILGIGSAVAFATVDVVYTARGRIANVYLADAAVEAALLGAWALRA